jgi:dienelactone hydrolase
MKNLIVLILTLPLAIISCKTESKDKAASKQTSTIQKEDPVSIVGEEITYKTDSTLMRGYVAHNSAIDEERPGIIVVHEWWGHDDFARKKAEKLAELGYVALAVDMYGQGKTANHPEEAMAFSSKVMKNFDTAKARFEAAVETLKADKNVDNNKISAIGFCFGGSVALSMANTGADLDAVAVFHSGLGLPVMPNENLKAKLLIQNGAEDMMITDEQISTFKSQLDDVNADYEYIAYEGVKHSFTNKKADSLGKKYNLPLAYDKEAAEKSWEKMNLFLEKTYGN